MIKRLALFPLILLLLASVGRAAAQTSGPIQAEIQVAAADYTVGDPVELTLAITHPDDYHIILPQLEEMWGDFTVYAQATPQTVSNGDGTKTTTQTIDVRLFVPGSYDTPPLTIKATDAAGQLSEVIASPASVNVSSVLVEGDTTLRDIKAQADLPFRAIWPWVVGLALLVVVAGALALRLWLKKRRGQVAVDNRQPHEVALDELARIEQLGLPQAGRFKEHYSLVSDCLRLYVEQRYRLPALERTTAEIRDDLKRAPVDQRFASLLLQLLNEADLVKFAKYKPQVPDAQLLVTNTRAIVEMTKPSPVPETANNDNLQMPKPISSALGQSVSQNGAQRHTEVNA